MAIIPRSFFPVALPEAANLATAPRGVAFEACPPVLEYTSVSRTRMLRSRPAAGAGAGRPGGGPAGTLVEDARLGGLVGADEPLHQLGAHHVTKVAHRTARGVAPGVGP